MGKRNIFIILLLLCLIFTLPSISASDTIDPGGGTGDNLTDIPINNVLTLSYQEDSILTEGEGTFSELQGLIDTSSDGKVQLEKNYKFDPTKDDESLKEGILLNKKIEIDGNQFIIDGNNQARIFNISGSNIILKGITLQNAKSSGNGGAIYWSGQVGLMDNVTFANNTAGENGGAVFLIHNENTKVKNSKFINNSAGINGGAIEWSQGAKNGEIDNVTFINNTAKRSGGAVYWYGN